MKCCLQHEQTLGRIQQVQNFGATSVHRCRATHGRFILTTFLCTLQDVTSGNAFINTLQHSIPGEWLTLTRTGVTPARQADLASPHVQRYVIRRVFLAICQWIGPCEEHQLTEPLPRKRRTIQCREIVLGEGNEFPIQSMHKHRDSQLLVVWSVAPHP